MRIIPTLSYVEMQHLLFDLPEQIASEVLSQPGFVVTAGVQFKHVRLKEYKNLLRKLPNLQRPAEHTFQKMMTDPLSVLTKITVNPHGDVWSAAIGYGSRALAVKVGNTFYWYWVGSHESYTRLKDAVPPVIAPTEQYLRQKEDQRTHRQSNPLPTTDPPVPSKQPTNRPPLRT